MISELCEVEYEPEFVKFRGREYHPSEISSMFCCGRCITCSMRKGCESRRGFCYID